MKKIPFYIIILTFYGCQNNSAEILPCNLQVDDGITYSNGIKYSGTCNMFYNDTLLWNFPHYLLWSYIGTAHMPKNRTPYCASPCFDFHLQLRWGSLQEPVELVLPTLDCLLPSTWLKRLEYRAFGESSSLGNIPQPLGRHLCQWGHMLQCSLLFQ